MPGDSATWSKVPSANTIIEYMNMPELTPILQECIEFTALVLRPYEVHFAADSSGFRASHYQRWCEEKHGKNRDEDEELIERKKREWRKVHIVVGVNTQVVVAVRVGGGDYPRFIPMLERVRELFEVQSVSGDGGYTGYSNYEAADRWGVTAYLPFDGRHVRPPDTDQSTWAKSYRFQAEHPEEWKAGYHPRSNVETGFSTAKRLFGEIIRSNKLDAQINEVLIKMLCHNLVVLIHEMFAHGIYPFFAANPRFLDSLEEKDRKKLLDHGTRFVADGQNPVDADQFQHFDMPQQKPYPNGTSADDPFGLPHHVPQSGW